MGDEVAHWESKINSCEVCNSIYTLLKGCLKSKVKKKKERKKFVVRFAVWYCPLESVYLQPAIQSGGGGSIFWTGRGYQYRL